MRSPWRVALLCSLLAATAAANDDDALVAEVNGRAIRMSDVYREVESLPLGDQIAIRARIEVFAESLVREEILFQAALVTDLDATPGLREAIRSAVVEQLIEYHVRSRLDVSDEEIRAFYDANTSAIRGEEIRASQVLLRDRAECDAMLPTITSDAAFAQAAKAHSLHRPSGELGGDIGLFMNHDGPLGFESALFDLQPGDMAVFESGDGCHLVRIMTRDTPPLPPLERVRDSIRNLLLARKERRLLKALLERAEEKVDVRRSTPRP